MNTQGSAYHEYEYGGTRPIMNMNSQKRHYSSVFNLNTAVFMMSSALLSACQVGFRLMAQRGRSCAKLLVPDTPFQQPPPRLDDRLTFASAERAEATLRRKELQQTTSPRERNRGGICELCCSARCHSCPACQPQHQELQGRRQHHRARCQAHGCLTQSHRQR